jgi:hypothetical protein
MAVVARVGLRSDGGFAVQEFFGEFFEGLGPLVAFGVGIRISDESFFGADGCRKLRLRVSDAAFEGDFAGANASEKDTAHVFDVAEGGVERELGVIGAVALPAGGGDEAGFVVEEEAGVVCEEVDAVGAEVEAEVADLDVFEALFAGFDGEGLALRPQG